MTLYNFCESIMSGSPKSASDSTLAVTETSETTDSDGDAIPPVISSLEVEEEMLKFERADADAFTPRVDVISKYY
jgi:hypothetical protein